MSRTSVDLTLSGFTTPLPVMKLRGVEALSHPYRFDLVVNLPADTRAEALVDHDARIALDTLRTPARIVAGRVERARMGSSLTDGSRAVRLRVVPHWASLALRRNSRIFQDRTTLEIAAVVALEHGVVVQPALRTPPRTRTYCVQHQESDLDFLERLFADEGLTYFFAEPEDGAARQAVVVTDHATGYRPILGTTQLVLHALTPGQAAGALQLEEHDVTSFALEARSRTTAIATREYDLTRPDNPVLGDALGTTPELDGRGWYEHHGAYGEAQPVFNADVVREQVARSKQSGSGVSVCRRLAPGHAFDLDAEETAVSGGYAITQVRHVADAEAGDRGGLVYESRFSVVSGDTLHRPPRPAARLHQVLETATVVGPAHEEIYTDELGRIKVQFHWDREGARDERSSCWLRTSQSWAGSNWGAQFIPRLGMEVIVGFLGGDIDRPIVLGAVGNATHLAPFPLPEERARSGIRTQTVGGEGYNELSFSDVAGGEEIRIRAQHDLREEVLHDAQTHIRGDATRTVGGIEQNTVLGSKTTQVTGLLETRAMGGLRTAVRGGSDVSLEGATRINVDGDTLMGIAGNAALSSGPLRIEAVQSVQLGVRDASNMGSVAIRSEGRADIFATREIHVASDEMIRLKCGETEITLLHDTLRIRSPKIDIAATESLQATGNGPSLTLGDRAELVAKSVQIFSESAAVELGQGAKVWGKSINLLGPPSSLKKPGSDKDALTQPLKIRFLDERREPYRGATYHLIAAGERVIGTLDDDGGLAVEVPDAATTAEVTLWIDAYPEGRRKHHVFRLADLPPTSTTAGIKHRLKSLGYYRGLVNDIFDRELTAALKHLQEERGIVPPDGRATPETIAALEELYGH